MELKLPGPRHGVRAVCTPAQRRRSGKRKRASGVKRWRTRPTPSGSGIRVLSKGFSCAVPASSRARNPSAPAARSSTCPRQRPDAPLMPLVGRVKQQLCAISVAPESAALARSRRDARWPSTPRSRASTACWWRHACRASKRRWMPQMSSTMQPLLLPAHRFTHGQGEVGPRGLGARRDPRTLWTSTQAKCKCRVRSRRNKCPSSQN